MVIFFCYNYYNERGTPRITKGYKTMTKHEMLLKMIAQSGWTVTTDKDEDGYKIAIATDTKTERAAV